MFLNGIQWDGSNLLTVIGAVVCFYYLNLSIPSLEVSKDRRQCCQRSAYSDTTDFILSLNSMWTWACGHEPCSSFSREANEYQCLKPWHLSIVFLHLDTAVWIGLKRKDQWIFYNTGTSFIKLAFHFSGSESFQFLKRQILSDLSTAKSTIRDNELQWPELRDEAVLEFV